MESILAKLYEYEDKEYAVFQSKLTPTIDPGTFIGVRVPHLRKLAKELVNTPEAEAFMNELPHKYYDENMLHAAIITEVKDYETSLKLVESFCRT